MLQHIRPLTGYSITSLQRLWSAACVPCYCSHIPVSTPIPGHARSLCTNATSETHVAPSKLLAEYLRLLGTDKFIVDMAAGVRRGDRLALSRAITLCESSRPDHASQAARMLQLLTEQQKLQGMPDVPSMDSFRIAVSGPPGVGKSSLIETLGCALVEAGHKMAVLAIDPSSQHSGGAILGDKTRMPRLSADSRAYVRPTPTRGSLGGIARATADSILVCEAAGYKQVLIETVGVGQSETAVIDLVDCLLLVMPPVGGDDLQVIKKGIMEVADIVVVNKADGPTAIAAANAAAGIAGTLGMVRSQRQSWTPQVLACSAHDGTNMDKLVAMLQNYQTCLRQSGELAALRKHQRRRLVWIAMEEAVLDRLRADQMVQQTVNSLMPEVLAGRMAPRAAADVAAAAFKPAS
ncbi:hypothetical protein WJX72_002862 [[Myrmecia] bisecta]|uniref:Uncharacterized protein n=1 Tax=[Myrmecia] bisecta TaxID=41462 RepID=A0AAW1R583_9CHLO